MDLSHDEEGDVALEQGQLSQLDFLAPKVHHKELRELLESLMPKELVHE